MLRASSVTIPQANRNEAGRLAREVDLVSREFQAAKRDLADEDSQFGASNCWGYVRLTFDAGIADLVHCHPDGCLRDRLRGEVVFGARPFLGGVVVQLVASGSRATCVCFWRHSLRPHFGSAVC